MPPAFQLYIQASVAPGDRKSGSYGPPSSSFSCPWLLLTGYPVLDHWHHPCDAFFGFFQGALMAFWVVSDAMGHLGTGGLLCLGALKYAWHLISYRKGVQEEARLEWGSGHGMKVVSAHHNLSRLHPCRFSTSQAMPSPRTTYALCVPRSSHFPSLYSSPPPR